MVPFLMMTSKSAGPGDEDRSCANPATAGRNTIVKNAPSQKKFRFIKPIQEAPDNDVDLKPQLSRATCALWRWSQATRCTPTSNRCLPVPQAGKPMPHCATHDRMRDTARFL